MLLIVTSEADLASQTIREELLAQGDWRAAGTFEGHPVVRSADRVLVTIEAEHLSRDHLDRDLRRELDVSPQAIAYASRHRSESGRPSLTVHPLGNFGEARFGGRVGRLVPTAPHWMTEALRRLHTEAAGLPYSVSFEATHHGPLLECPTFFIEVGSDEAAWRDRRPTGAVARTLLRLTPPSYPVAIGLGGGHYVPRLRDVALRREISFGHLIPNYALEHLDEDLLRQAVDCTPGATKAYLHRQAVTGGLWERIRPLVEAVGLTPVRERDLAALPPVTPPR